jgi:hypothetical protein
VIRASPTVADGRIYCLSEAGEVLVFDSSKFRLMSRHLLEGNGVSRASIAIAHNQIFVRAGDRLYAFRKQSE